MTTYKITFGTGKDAITMVNQTGDLADILSGLKLKGWETESITSIVVQ